MKNLRNIAFVLLASLLGSCTEVIDFDPGDVSPCPVLVSQPCTDTIVTVFLNQSRFFLDNANYNTSISDAVLTLDVNGTAYTASYDSSAYNYAGGGCYYFNVVPREGDKLSLTARIPSMDKIVTATTQVPQKARIEITDYVIDTVCGGYDDYYYYGGTNAFRIRFKVKSNGADEYFSVRLYAGQFRNSDWDNSVMVWDTVDKMAMYFEVNDPLVNSYEVLDLVDESDRVFYGYEMLFSSELFQNGEHEFTAEFTEWIGDYEGLDIKDFPLWIEVKAFSPELYRYSLTAEKQDQVNGLLSEPVQVISNVEGGIGVFGAFSRRLIRLTSPRFETFYNNTNYKK